VQTRVVIIVCMSVLGLVGVCQAQSLRQLHNGCDHPTKSRTPECVAAMHRYCSSPFPGSAGISQEVGVASVGVACIPTTTVEVVELRTLQAKVSSCMKTHSQSQSCMSAAHRWCSDTGRGGSGVAQEVGTRLFCAGGPKGGGCAQVAEFAVACFNPTSYQIVPIGDLAALHAGCNSTAKSQHADCVAAIHRWCTNSGSGGGVAQETGNGVLGVACFSVAKYADVPLR